MYKKIIIFMQKECPKEIVDTCDAKIKRVCLSNGNRICDTRIQIRQKTNVLWNKICVFSLFSYIIFYTCMYAYNICTLFISFFCLNKKDSRYIFCMWSFWRPTYYGNKNTHRRVPVFVHKCVYKCICNSVNFILLWFLILK